MVNIVDLLNMHYTLFKNKSLRFNENMHDSYKNYWYANAVIYFGNPAEKVCAHTIYLDSNLIFF